jgi:hypothetical protein
MPARVACAAGQLIERHAGRSACQILCSVASRRIGSDLQHPRRWRKGSRIDYFVILRITQRKYEAP